MVKLIDVGMFIAYLIESTALANVYGIDLHKTVLIKIAFLKKKTCSLLGSHFLETAYSRRNLKAIGCYLFKIAFI